MISKYYSIDSRCNAWTNFRISIALEKQFTSYEKAMLKVVQDREEDAAHPMYYGYIAPVLLQLFQYYNSDISAFEVLCQSIEYLQTLQAANPMGEILLKDFIEIANKVGVQVRTVTYKVNS
ncbi:hypothetical protein ACOJB1_12775 [Enterococcus innesii]|uniref:hypothetical protein n=1 Tax=Enterococcus innesii TaxID=2839759 RepID=UPI003B596B9D